MFITHTHTYHLRRCSWGSATVLYMNRTPPPFRNSMSRTPTLDSMSPCPDDLLGMCRRLPNPLRTSPLGMYGWYVCEFRTWWTAPGSSPTLTAARHCSYPYPHRWVAWWWWGRTWSRTWVGWVARRRCQRRCGRPLSRSVRREPVGWKVEERGGCGGMGVALSRVN